ncbi:nucleotide disphospho-sugar-binding domain-containing protein [Streptomyces sp. NPDC048392]|uniref:nucleotide disphospho-sugar-binding domain-containing protein n=1 Tax=Streptomyces sp. NPDC048392 TaxID=3365543 RepID=UPI00372339BD
MAHIALMSVPLHGHVNPLLGVAAELVAHGHRVTFATGRGFTTLIEETGATAVGYDSTFPVPGGERQDWLPDDDDGSLAVEAFTREREAVLPQVAEAYARDRPDLVVYDTVTGHAPVLARWWGVPEVQFSPSHVFPEGTAGPGTGSGRGALTELVPCVVALPRPLQFQAENTGRNHVFVGPTGWRRPAHGEWTPPADDRPVALVSLGTTYNTRTELFRWAAEAFGALDGRDWHVVVAIGHNTDPGALGELPAGVEVRPWVPQQAVLARAEVFVTAGGTGSVLEGLSCGVPLVVLPQAIEQFVTASRVAELGVGRTVLPAEASADSLLAALRAVVSDPGTARRLAGMRAEIAACGGAREAADVVCARLPGRTLPAAAGTGPARRSPDPGHGAPPGGPTAPAGRPSRTAARRDRP